MQLNCNELHFWTCKCWHVPLSLFLPLYFLGNQCHAGVLCTIFQKEKADWNGFREEQENHKKDWKIMLPVWGKVNRAGHVHSGKKEIEGRHKIPVYRYVKGHCKGRRNELFSPVHEEREVTGLCYSRKKYVKNQACWIIEKCVCKYVC